MPGAYRIGDYIFSPGEGIIPVLDGMQAMPSRFHRDEKHPAELRIDYKDGRHRYTSIPEKELFHFIVQGIAITFTPKIGKPEEQTP